MLLRNKVAAITGAGSGIGRAVALSFAAEGADLILIGRNSAKLELVAEEVKSSTNKQVAVQPADVSNVDEIYIAMEKGVQQLGSLHILSHNAAIFPRSSIETMEPAEWNSVIETNLNGSLYTLKACLPFLKQQDSSSVVFTSSVAGSDMGIPTLSHYAASKAGLDGLMRSAAIELVRYGIRVNSVAPGATQTFEVDTGELKQMVEAISTSIPMGRLALPEEVAKSCLFLASDMSSYITGQRIVIDGGQTALGESRHLTREFWK